MLGTFFICYERGRRVTVNEDDNLVFNLLYQKLLLILFRFEYFDNKGYVYAENNV